MHSSFPRNYLFVLLTSITLYACHTHKIHPRSQSSASQTKPIQNKQCSKPYYTWAPLILSLGSLSGGLISNYTSRTCLQVNQAGQCIKDKASHTISIDLALLGGVGSIISYAHHRYAWQKTCLYKNINQYDETRSLFLLK